MQREVDELRRRLESDVSIDEGAAAGGADRYKLREHDRDRQAWDKVRGIVRRLKTPLDRPTGRSLDLIQAEGRAHTNYLSLLFGERVEVRFDRCPVDPFERCGASWAARLACDRVYWDARDRMPDPPIDWAGYVVLRDNVNALARESGLLRGLVELRIARTLPDCLESDKYVDSFVLDFLVCGPEAAPAGLVLRPRAFHFMWGKMGEIDEIARYYGASAIADASADIAEPVSAARRAQRGGRGV